MRHREYLRIEGLHRERVQPEFQFQLQFFPSSQENCILTRYRITYGVSMTAKKPFTEQKKQEALLEFHTVLVY